MIESFNTLMELNLDGKVSKKPTFKWDANKKETVETETKLDYLNWADCLELLHQHGAETVRFGNVRSTDDHPLFTLNGTLPFVHIFVDIDGDRRDLDYPLIEGSKDVKMDKVDQSDVHNASQRAFVKCVAINWGLGLSLWQKEENLPPAKPPKDDLMGHNIYSIQTRIQQLITTVMQKSGDSKREICDKIGMSEKLLDSTMSIGFKNIAMLEDKLRNYDKQPRS